MKWKIKQILDTTDEKARDYGYYLFAFHDNDGNKYASNYFEHWLGYVGPDNKFEWTAGAVDKGLSKCHISFDLKNPHYMTKSPDGSHLVSSGGTNKIYKIFPEKKTAELFIDAGKLGLRNAGNCVYDTEGNIWVNDFTGCQMWQFDPTGKPKLTIGDGISGFQKESVPFERARFNWAYDLRLGPDGNIYVLDSKNFAVRMIDLSNKVVTTLVGTGKSGYSGDGESALNATLGSKEDEHFDGPLSLSLDEIGNIYIGDTFNHVVRMVERSSNIISTIAGNNQIKPHKRNDPNEKDPLSLNLPKICSMDYYDRCLFIPEWDGDLVILEKI